MKPDIAEKAANITMQQYKEYQAFKMNKLEDLRQHRHVRDLPSHLQHIFTAELALKSAKRVAWGSDEERQVARSEAFAYMQESGLPTLMLTCSPDAVNSVEVMVLSGAQPSIAIDVDHLLPLSERRKVVGKNPVVCAQMFHRLVCIIMDKLFNYDVALGKSREEPGWFGFVEKFYISTEQQGGLTLHMHSLVWLKGFAKVPEDIPHFSEDNDYDDRVRVEELANYHQDIMTNELPLDYEWGKCPNCLCQVESLEFSAPMYKKRRGRDDPHVTIRCTGCEKSYASHEYLQECLGYVISRLPHDKKVVVEGWTDDFLLLQTVIDFGDDVLNSIAITRLVCIYQQHFWHHSKSCFKKSARTPSGKVCRFLFPKRSNNIKSFTGSGNILLKRPVGHEYINSRLKGLDNVFLFNVDIKIFIGGANLGAKSIYYCVKYCTKSQRGYEQFTHLHLSAMQKAIDREAEREASGDVRTLLEKGKSRLFSLINSLTKPAEIGNQSPPNQLRI